MIPVSLVTPSTRLAISSPKRAATSSSDARRVLDGVVQQRGAERLGVEPQARADLRDADRVDDELLAGAPALVGVVLAGEHERLLDAVAVDRDERLVGVLLDDREEVAEQLALARGELGAATATERQPSTRAIGGRDVPGSRSVALRRLLP